MYMNMENIITMITRTNVAVDIIITTMNVAVDMNTTMTITVTADTTTTTTGMIAAADIITKEE